MSNIVFRLLFSCTLFPFFLLNYSYAKVQSGNSSQNTLLNGFTIVQDTLDVNRKSDILYFSIRAYTPKGLKRISICFVSPSGNEHLDQYFTISSPVENKLVLGNIHFPKKSENGNWYAKEIVIENSLGEKRIFQNKLIQQKGFKTTIFIRGKVVHSQNPN